VVRQPKYFALSSRSFEITHFVYPDVRIERIAITLRVQLICKFIVNFSLAAEDSMRLFGYLHYLNHFKFLNQ